MIQFKLHSKLRLFIFIVGVFSFIPAVFPAVPACAATSITSDIIQNTTWTKTGSPYQINKTIKVTIGHTLTIQPGVTVQFMGPYSLLIETSLNASGTALEPIIFTDSNPTPIKGSWGTIQLGGCIPVLWGHVGVYEKFPKIL